MAQRAIMIDHKALSYIVTTPKARFDINPRLPVSSVTVLVYSKQNTAEFLARSNKISNLINEIELDHKEKDWDGYGANPVNIKSLNYAGEFLRRLEMAVPLPSGGCEPSGRVGIEWVTDKMRLSVAFNDDGSITYAGVNKEGKIFSGKNPLELDNRIKQFVTNNATTIS